MIREVGRFDSAKIVTFGISELVVFSVWADRVDSPSVHDQVRFYHHKGFATILIETPKKSASCNMHPLCWLVRGVFEMFMKNVF